MPDLAYTVHLRRLPVGWRFHVAHHTDPGTATHLAAGWRITRPAALRAAVTAVQNAFADRNAAGERVRPGALKIDGEPLGLHELIDLADSLHPHAPHPPTKETP